MREEMFVSSTDASQQLHCVVWSPEQSPVAVLQIVHGMEEYIARYEPLATALVSRGWAVIGHDHLGHGQSGRWERGFFTERNDGASVLIEDIQVVNTLARERWPQLPVFIFGHSMGSFFLRRFLAVHPESAVGAVICGSGFYNTLATGTAYWAARFFCKIKGMHAKSNVLTAICSLPFLFAFRNEGRYAWLSRNKANVEAYRTDPLCGFGFTCGGYLHMYANLKLVSQHADYDRLKPMPLLVISGSDDPVGGTSAVRKISKEYRRYGFTDVSESVRKCDRHEILFEDDAEETIEIIAEWLEERFRRLC